MPEPFHPERAREGMDNWLLIKPPRVGNATLNQSLVNDVKTNSFNPPSAIAGIVVPDSRPTLRKAATQLALYFRREFHYDFVQFGEDGSQDDPKDVAFLYVADRRTSSQSVIGCCSFRWRTSEDTACYAMQWAWFHPYFRRCGQLSESWEYFRSRFGLFQLEGPLSPAMLSFLHKNDPGYESRVL